ncbi:DUF429 domain-containing protein [Siculibacillus lacustris]|uniref:DUF429 domain-containing protein n=1 Tax=Siculibacillus lacustris TaxID=1549641 RepID=A0A4Q9VW79_9HYPH|nr:DUF429 domain-containing protein [Siculibacillus lacustris]TBW40083.1 DUF429 domain-containing protein [Siculibacillus lacustris]
MTAPDAREAPPVLAGVDGCPAGWLACRVAATGPLMPEIRIFPRIADLLDGPDAPALTAIDMPIGLSDAVGPGGRGPERLVRARLGARQSSVFSIPARAAVFAGEGLDEREAYARACATALATSTPPRKVSKQGFHLFPKIRELDRWMTPERAARVIESHPELAFAHLNGGAPMTLPKKVEGRPNPPGLDERRDLLVAHGFERALLEARPPRGAAADDLLDACVLALVARRWVAGRGVSHPAEPEHDARGLPMRICA